MSDTLGWMDKPASECAKPIRFVQTYPIGQTEEDRKALATHKAAIGPDVGPRSTQQAEHRAQVSYHKVGWNGRPIFEMTCMACGIRWRND